jgi:anthranilate phosphoribosyltransferase
MRELHKNFGKLVDKLISGQNLSREETREAFVQILKKEQTEIHQGAFLAAITAKGPHPQEIAGAWEAIFELDTVKVRPETTKPLLENCGTGMDGFKTFNISTTAALIGAAGNRAMARHGARAITSNCGTVDLCEALGVDVECAPDLVKESIEECGIGIFNGMSQTVHPQALFRILSQMSFGSILNITASLANPVCPKYGVRGVYAKDLVLPVAQIMKEIGFKRAVVFHGLTGNGQGGIDELSPVHKSLVAELSEDGEIREFEIWPQEVGINKRAHLQEIARGDSIQDEALRLLRIICGKDRSTLYETVCLNAAPIFYVSGAVSSFKQGMEMSRAIIDSGKVLDGLCKWVNVQNSDSKLGKEKLESLLGFV